MQSFQVHDILESFSDHCPISLVLDVKADRLVKHKAAFSQRAPKNKKWDPMQEGIFKANLQSPMVKNGIKNIFSNCINDVSDIDCCIRNVNSVLCNAANIAEKRVSKISASKKVNKRKVKRQKEWFGKDLQCLRHELQSLGKLLIKDYTNTFLQ